MWRLQYLLRPGSALLHSDVLICIHTCVIHCLTSSPNFMVCGFGRMALPQPARRGQRSDSVCARAVTQLRTGGCESQRKGVGCLSAAAAKCQPSTSHFSLNKNTLGAACMRQNYSESLKALKHNRTQIHVVM